MHDRIIAVRTKIQNLDKYMFSMTCSPKLQRMPNDVHHLEQVADELAEIVMVLYTRTR